MKVINVKIDAVQYGNCPIDYMYFAEQEVLLEDESKLYIQGTNEPGGLVCYSVSKGSIFNEKIYPQYLKQYSSLGRASRSKYYENFKEIKKILEDTEKENLAKIDDTKNFEPGIRLGGKLSDEGPCFFAEVFAKSYNLDGYYYLQVQRINDVSHYSVTEKSVYLRISLEGLYKVYYRDAKEIKPLIEVDNLGDLNYFSFLKDIFLQIDKIIDDHIKDINSK